MLYNYKYRSVFVDIQADPLNVSIIAQVQLIENISALTRNSYSSPAKLNLAEIGGEL